MRQSGKERAPGDIVTGVPGGQRMLRLRGWAACWVLTGTFSTAAAA